MKKQRGAIAGIKEDEEWRVEDDMRTLMRAKEIEADPKRIAKVKIMAEKKLKEVAGVLSEAGEKSS